MATVYTPRAGLNQKAAQPLLPLPASAAGSFTIKAHADYDPDQAVLLMTSTINVAHFYYPKHDHYAQIASPALAVAATGGACGTWHPGGPTGTASAGSTTSITTTITTVRNLAGFKVRITGGAGAGEERTILYNTIGANAVFTFSVGTALDNTSVFQLRTGRFYVLMPGTLAANYFKSYDVATGVWTSLAITGLPATWTAAEARMVPTFGPPLQTSLAVTSATGTTLTATGTTWTASKWVNAQVRIVSGLGAGQVRTITANTGTVLTVSTWTTTPDNTSSFVIEPNEDYLYILGNGAVALYRYSISGNTTSTITPGVARAGAPAAGFSAFFINVQTSALWSNANTGLDGKYIYSPRGGGVATIDRYDIPGNTWDAITPAQGSAEAPTTGSSWTEASGYLYCQLNATGRFLRYRPETNILEGWSTIGASYTQGAAALGDRCFSYSFIDGATAIDFVYFWANTSTLLVRIMVL